jgi:hypothetical protein
MVDNQGSEKSKNYLLLVDQYASCFDRPELRLRFLSRTLGIESEKQEAWHRRLRYLSFIERSRPFGWLRELELFRTIVVEFKLLMPLASSARRNIWLEAPWHARLFYYLYSVRHLVYILLIAIGTTSVVGAGRLIRRSALFRASQTASVAQQSASSTNALAAPRIDFLPQYQPDKVWLVEKSAEFERYSNGARILTGYETSNHQRAYYLFPLKEGAAAPSEVQRHPIGIVFHSSESDMIPFTSDNSDSIQSIGAGLRGYIRRHRSYNYLIDRFGEIHRIVTDDQAANHAGHSVWADGNNLYVGLNESFIGVCFESTSASGTLAEQLTEAQLVSGRALTAVLRSRYQISDANCTTHGLVSVDPERQTIAHHHDWVRNFPFAAFSLSDKYSVAPVSVSLFGFGTDATIMEKLGGHTWPGAEAAEVEFQRKAQADRITVDEARRRSLGLYRTQMEREWALRQQPGGEVSGVGER